jgi:hypothetical protein
LPTWTEHVRPDEGNECCGDVGEGQHGVSRPVPAGARIVPPTVLDTCSYLLFSAADDEKKTFSPN